MKAALEILAIMLLVFVSTCLFVMGIFSKPEVVTVVQHDSINSQRQQFAIDCTAGRGIIKIDESDYACFLARVDRE